MSTTRDLLTGLAQIIADSSIAVYDPVGAYAATDTGVVLMKLPSTPDRVVALWAVPLTDGTMTPIGQTLIQVRTRGLPDQPLDTEDLGDAVFDLLHGIRNHPLGSVNIIQILRKSSIPNGQDNSKRFERIDHFYADIDYPPTTNRPAMGWDG
jgi:hypothetical protein